jgi:hypothetical protein
LESTSRQMRAFTNSASRLLAPAAKGGQRRRYTRIGIST